MFSARKNDFHTTVCFALTCPSRLGSESVAGMRQNTQDRVVLSIPTNLATDSEGIWPTLPIERGHLF
jgi:hypothetical protein